MSARTPGRISQSRVGRYSASSIAPPVVNVPSCDVMLDSGFWSVTAMLPPCETLWTEPSTPVVTLSVSSGFQVRCHDGSATSTLKSVPIE